MNALRHVLGATVLIAALAACALPVLGAKPEPVKWTLLVSPPSASAEQAARASMDDAELLVASFAFSHDFGNAYSRGIAREVQVFATKESSIASCR